MNLRDYKMKYAQITLEQNNNWFMHMQSCAREMEKGR